MIAIFRSFVVDIHGVVADMYMRLFFYTHASLLYSEFSWFMSAAEIHLLSKQGSPRVDILNVITYVWILYLLQFPFPTADSKIKEQSTCTKVQFEVTYQ